jgi:cytochrome c1
MDIVAEGMTFMTVKERCRNCGGTSFVQATDYVSLRPLGKKMAIGTEKIYTVCLDCGEVLSIKVKDPEKLK